MEVQATLLKPERTKRESLRLSRQLSRRYPGMPLDLALREENAKLRKELEHMRVSTINFPLTNIPSRLLPENETCKGVNVQANRKLEECNVIEHLLDFTEAAAADPVILKEAMSQIAEDDEEDEKSTITKKELPQVKHPKPSLYVPISLILEQLRGQDSIHPQFHQIIDIIQYAILADSLCFLCARSQPFSYIIFT